MLTKVEPLQRIGQEQLWREHRDELLRYAAVLVGPSDAHDVTVEAFLSASTAALGPSVSNPRAYLFQAVANRAASQRRAALRRQRRELTATRNVPPGETDDLRHVRRAVANLTVKQRAVVYLTYWEDLDERSIATVLGIAPGTVHDTLARARVILRKALS